MKANIIKRIIGVIILVAAFNYTYVVHAEDPSSNDWLAVFGIRLGAVGSGEEVSTALVFNPEDKEKYCGYKFKITKINNSTEFDATALEIPAQITCGADHDGNPTSSTYILKIAPTEAGADLLSTGVSVTLQSEQKVPLGNKKYTVEMTITYTEDGANDDGQDYEPGNGTFEDIGSGTFIDCDNYANKYSKNSFNYEFCRVKAGAAASNNVFNNINGSYQGNTKEFSCSMNPNDINVNWSSLTGDDYFVNKGYLFGESTETQLSATYYYHYAPGSGTGSPVTGTETATCKIKCQEAVEVEFGPPVASKAGLCFEYKVRVTSRVSCYTYGNIDKPDKHTYYCTPRPSCIHGKQELTQAGPKEDFDYCINNCDGGKYTKKCSNKCYVEVYGSIAAGALATGTANSDTNATLMAYHPDCPTCGQNGVWADELDGYSCLGYYSRSGNNDPIWNPRTYSSRNPRRYIERSAGRWYCEHRLGQPVSNPWHPLYDLNKYYVADMDGFFRYIKTNTACTDRCSWKTLYSSRCKDDSYINKYVPCKVDGQYDYSSSSLCQKKGYYKDFINILDYDYATNVEIYNDLVRRCKARATCTTTISYYTISAKYGQKDTTAVTTVDFPYNTRDFAYFDASAGTSSNSATNKQTTLFINYPSDNKGLSGCYNKVDDSKYTLNPASGSEAAHLTDLYRTTWGFPGTWVNIKTGEVSYSGAGTGTESVWRLYDDKFCLPNNAKDVNIDWYDAYRAKELLHGNVWKNRLSSVVVQKIIDKCYKHTFITLSTPNFPVTSVDYNIIAHAVDFGFFNWDIDIKCFYALHSRPFVHYDTDSETEYICDPTSPDPIRIHAADPINLFPNSDGSDITSPSDSGRTVGFNWSEYAINDKNPDYISNPPKLMQNIQTIADAGNTYSDDYLDYQFYMSPQNIRALRSYKYHPFADSGFDVSENGVVHYKSDLIRENKFFSNIVVPQGWAVNCNNIDKTSSKDSNGCLDLSKIKIK